jgi:hypothetical protein
MSAELMEAEMLTLLDLLELYILLNCLIISFVAFNGTRPGEECG